MAGRRPSGGKSQTSLSARVVIEGADGLERALRKLPKDAKDEIKLVSALLATDVAEGVRAAANRHGRRSMLLGRTVKAQRSGSTPGVAVGGSVGLPTSHGRVPAYKLLFGDEFGAGQKGDGRRGKYAPFGYHAYVPSSSGRGGAGTWIFPTVHEDMKHIGAAWVTAANRIIDEFGSGE